MRAVTLCLSVTLLSLACGGSGGEPAGRPAASAAKPESPASGKLDVCKLVAQAEATALFGEAASRASGAPVTDPSMLGECIWEHASGIGSHQLQVRVWGSPQYYAPLEDEFTKPLDVGEKGYVRVHSASGVDIAWVQGGRVIELSYFTVGGAGMPKATDRVSAVTQLARQTSGRL